MLQRGSGRGEGAGGSQLVTWQLWQEVDLATRKRHSSLSRVWSEGAAFRVNFLALFMVAISQSAVRERERRRANERRAAGSRGYTH